MIVEETQLTADQVANLMSGLFSILTVYSKDVVLQSPGLGNELTKPHCLVVPSESPVVPEGYTGKVYLQYDGGNNQWAISEMFTIADHTRPGRIPIHTRDPFQAMALLGHWTGISGRLDPRDL